MSTEVFSLVGLPQETKYARVIQYSHQQYDLVLAVSFSGENANTITKQIEQQLFSALPFSSQAFYTLCNDLNEQYSHKGILQYAGILKNRDQLISVGYNGIVCLMCA